MTAYEFLNFDVSDGIAKITLNRPDAANGIHLPMGIELMKAAIRCDEDASIRAVILTGAGKMFCAGGDIQAFAQAGDGIGGFAKELTCYLHAAISRFTRMNAPLIVAVNGAAAGIGLSFALSGDIVLAAESAKFTVAYTGIGASPDGGSSYLLPRVVGMRRAQELILTNRRLSAAEAAEMGVATRVVADDQLLAEAEKVAAQLAAGPLQAHGKAKRLLLGSFSETLETQMELEARAIAEQLSGPEGREGVAAFVAKRKPQF